MNFTLWMCKAFRWDRYRLPPPLLSYVLAVLEGVNCWRVILRTVIDSLGLYVMFDMKPRGCADRVLMKRLLCPPLIHALFPSKVIRTGKSESRNKSVTSNSPHAKVNAVLCGNWMMHSLMLPSLHGGWCKQKCNAVRMLHVPVGRDVFHLLITQM